MKLKGSFYSASAAFEALKQEAVDLLFCDIQMPELSGMELARMLPERTKVIFTTAFSNYAVEGFRVNALDYLLKPISYPDFLESASKALKWFGMAGNDAGSGSVDSLFVKTDYRLLRIGLDDILYIERGRVVFGKVRIPVSDTYRQGLHDFLGRHSVFL